MRTSPVGATELVPVSGASEEGLEYPFGMTESLSILYIHSHDTGRCMEPFGFPVRMPAYQDFAESGAVFRRAFSAAPTCSPSRAALLTRRAPHSSGMLGLAHRGFELHDRKHHLARYLARHGYHTALAGHQHLTTGNPHDLGYQDVLDAGDGLASEVVPNSVELIQKLSNGKDRSPFFLDVGFTEAHRPFPEVDSNAGRYVAPLPGIPDTSAIRQDTAAFHASLRELDRGVGDVLDALDHAGMSDRTIVIVTTDHGPAFPGLKSTLTDRGLGVGLMMRVPDVTSKGSVIDALVSQVDLFPTLCELCSLPAPNWLQGVSLVPVLAGKAAHVRDAVFGEVTFHAAYDPQRSIRTERWTYIRRFGDRIEPVLPNVDASPALDWMIDHGWDWIPVERIQRFDNALDPMQQHNLAGTESHLQIETELASRLSNWMESTEDPLLNGSVPLPKGAVTNRASDRDPDGELVTEDFM